MITLRCTKSLLRRVGTHAAEEDDQPSALGDWHGKEVVTGDRKRVFLFVNDRTFICVLLPAKKATVREQFRMRYARLLLRIGIPGPLIESELQSAQQIATATSNSRQVLGVLNDVVLQYRFQKDYEPGLSADQLEDLLLENIVSVNGYAMPANEVLRLLDRTSE